MAVAHECSDFDCCVFTVRKCIGAGTMVNMVCVGYGADLICWFVNDRIRLEMTMPLRIAALLAGCMFAGLGVAFYMVAEMGIAPYDSVALIIEKFTHNKIQFQYARVMSDVTCVVIGIVFCLTAGNNLWLIVGIGTLCNAFLTAPDPVFKKHISEPLLNGKNR